jgi:heat-inducible transcriptional repressor
MNDLNSRTKEILNVLIDEYVDTGYPVASESIVQNSEIEVSPATVRNEMVLLARKGYISKLHQFSGSIPLHKGYQLFIEMIPDDEPPEINDFTALKGKLNILPKTFEDCCENAISVISDLTGGVAFSKMYTSTSFVVDFIFFQIENELVITSKLSNGAVLEVKLNNVKNMNTEELQFLDNFIKLEIFGKTVDKMEEAKFLIYSIDTFLQQICIEIFEIHILRIRRSEEGKFKGANKVFDHPDVISQPMIAKSLLEIIENPLFFEDLIDLSKDNASFRVIIGEDNIENQMKWFSIIIAPFGLNHSLGGSIGLIVPKRIPYKRILPIVKYASFWIDRLFKRNIGEKSLVLE